MTAIFLYLRDHPLIGIISSMFAGILGLSAQKNQKLSEAIGGDNGIIDELTPYLSFFALGIGVMVGVLTMILKLLQIVKTRRELKKDKEDALKDS
jgi:hypothetical protein